MGIARDKAEDDYFSARPQIDCNDRRKVFEAGFELAWNARQTVKITQDQPIQFPAIILTIESHREAQILQRMAGLFAGKHAHGPVEIAFASEIEKWLEEKAGIEVCRQ